MNKKHKISLYVHYHASHSVKDLNMPIRESSMEWIKDVIQINTVHRKFKSDNRG